MRLSNRIRRTRGNVAEATIALGLAALVGAGGLGVSARAGGQETEPVRIDVTLDEYSFAPEPLRIPAGRPVTLVIRNVGRVAHEFMAGRDAEGDDFRQDLFADLHVNIEPAGMAADHAEHADAGQADAGHDHDAAPDAPADAAHAHGGEHEHGTMVEAGAGEVFLMTFTLPEDRRGEWATGCFLPGHYDAGMHGTLIVE